MTAAHEVTSSLVQSLFLVVVEAVEPIAFSPPPFPLPKKYNKAEKPKHIFEENQN